MESQIGNGDFGKEIFLFFFKSEFVFRKRDGLHTEASI
jgi:hypothetical protein